MSFFKRKKPQHEADTAFVNRIIFWRRVNYVLALFILYLVGAKLFFGVGVATALAILPGFMMTAAALIAQLGALLVANFLLFFGPFVLFARMGKEVYEPGDASWDTKISDVRGQKAAVAEMQRLLNLFKEGKTFVKAGGKRERGALMVGPPGTGKTMLAKAIATELSFPIMVASGASFGGIFFGMDAVAVYMLMRTARKRAKRWGGAVIFIDEIDALAQSRGGFGGVGGMGGMMSGGTNMGLNMLLTQMDGVDSPGFTKKLIRRMLNVTLDGLFIPRRIGGLSLRIPALKAPTYNLLFLGATNRPAVLDPAVTRPGRFGRQITFRNPTKQGRLDIADLYFSTKAHDPSLDTAERRDEFARITSGHSPAEIEQILSLALVYAFEENRERFEWKDVRAAIANVQSGLPEVVDYSERDKLGVSRHELGHAVAARFYESEKGMARLSIRMRGDSLGHFLNLDKEEEFLKLRSQVRSRLLVALGAKASEMVFYGENTAGVIGDLRQATEMAANMIGRWGMGKELNLSDEEDDKASRVGKYLISLTEAVGPYAGGEVTSVLAGYREAVGQVLGKAYIDAYRLMLLNKDAIDKGAVLLMEQQELVGDEIDGLLDGLGLQGPDKTDAKVYPPDVPKPEKKDDKK